MKIELYHTTVKLKKLVRNERDSRLATRLQAVYLALMGKSAPEIAMLLGYSRRTIQRWIYAYNKNGPQGLRDTPGRGQQSKLNTDQMQWLRQRIDDGPKPEDDICVFHAKDIQRIIKHKFAIEYHLRSVQKLLRRLGYRFLSSRPEHPKGDPRARDNFKKKSVIRSGKSVLIILEKQ